jgi:tRNA G10  N-methylase Trm11
MARLLGIDWEFTREDTLYLGHDLHPYPAKFIPQIPANLIAGLSLRGEVVWDPFGGSGTTALEALLLGRNAISTDANPLASLICKAKCSALSPEQRSELLSLNSRIRTLSNTPDLARVLLKIREKTSLKVPPIPNLLDWFLQESVEELSYIREEIETLDGPSSRTFALVALSSIVLASSFQDGETRYARRPRTLRPGRVLGMFAGALENSLRKHEPLEALLGYRKALVETADIRAIDHMKIIEPESVDLIVTSPPYANSTDYHLYHRFRLFWLGYDPRDFARLEIGSHLRHQREGKGYSLYEEEMSQALEQIWSRLRPGRYAAFVLGDSVFEGESYSTSKTVERIAERQGIEAVGTIKRDVHPTRRSFIPPARRAKKEEILILRKPPRRLLLSFRPPPYKMWPYEKELRRREISALLGVNTIRRDKTLSALLDCYQVDKARRLTFTHSFEAESGAPRWLTWQRLLENGDSRSARKDPKYLTHGIHPYKGKFYPQLAKSLLNLANLRSGARVLDPFCGSGTVLLESQLNGFAATGLDLNPLAVLISKAKVGVATESTVVLDRLMKDFFDRIIQDKSSRADLEYFRPDLRGEIARWFPTPVSCRIGWLLTMIQRVPHTTATLVLQVLLSSIVREVSQQAPEDLRIRRRKEPIHDAPVLELLRVRIKSFRERLRHFGERMSCAPITFNPGNVVLGDCRSWSTFQSLPTKSFDCVVTSPPYATALPYIDTDRLSLLTLFGLDSGSRARIEEDLTGSREIRERQRRELEAVVATDLEDRLRSKTAAHVIRKIHSLNAHSGVGFRRRNMSALLVRYFSDMLQTFQNLSRVVNPGAHLFFVIGDNKTVAGNKPVVITSGKALSEMGRSVGWRLCDSIPISVTREAPLHSRHAITENVVLHFEAL